MSVFSTLIAIRAFSGVRGVNRADFLDPLAITPEDGIEYQRATGEPWSSGLVQFPIIRLSQCQSAAEPSEEFAERTRQVFLLAARFLDAREPQAFERIRASGINVRLFIEVRMDQDQFDLELPPEFVRACGQRGLGISLMSNDISAEEAIRSRGSY